jgi:hypothetical protein
VRKCNASRECVCVTLGGDAQAINDGEVITLLKPRFL